MLLSDSLLCVNLDNDRLGRLVVRRLTVLHESGQQKEEYGWKQKYDGEIFEARSNQNAFFLLLKNDLISFVVELLKWQRKREREIKREKKLTIWALDECQATPECDCEVYVRWRESTRWLWGWIGICRACDRSWGGNRTRISPIWARKLFRAVGVRRANECCWSCPRSAGSQWSQVFWMSPRFYSKTKEQN